MSSAASRAPARKDVPKKSRKNLYFSPSDALYLPERHRLRQFLLRRPPASAYGDFTVALLPILQYPHPILAAKAEHVTDFNEELSTLAKNMAETMYAAPGVGLAANQVGVLKRIVVIDVTEDGTNLLTLVNPEVVVADGELKVHEEGCLSLKGLYENVKRPSHVVVRAQNLKGESVEIEAEGLLAVCLQHEIDHLDGVVFIDHLSSLKKARACTKLQKLKREREREKKKA